MISLRPFCLHAEFCIAVASRKIQSPVPLAELLVRSPFPDEELVWVPVALSPNRQVLQDGYSPLSQEGVGVWGPRQNTPACQLLWTVRILPDHPVLWEKAVGAWGALSQDDEGADPGSCLASSVCPLYPRAPCPVALVCPGQGRCAISAPLCPAVPVASQDCPQGCALFGQGLRGLAATAEIAPGTQVKTGAACPHLSPERVGAHTAWGKRKGDDAVLGVLSHLGSLLLSAGVPAVTELPFLPAISASE